MVLAHEYGHAISRLAGLARNDTPTLVAEQQADCFAGTYMRWVAEDSSPRFTLSTGEGLNNVLAGVVSFRDPVQSEGDPDAGFNEHGSAFERLSAFQFGFTDGPPACVGIDMRRDRTAARRTTRPAARGRHRRAADHRGVRCARSSMRWESCSLPKTLPH